MPQDKAQFINARQTKLETKKAMWEDIYRDIAAHMIPIREDIQDTKQDGSRQGSEIYDGSGSFALNTLVKGLYGKMINPALEWLKIRFKMDELNDIPEVREWTQLAAKRLLGSFADSNFYDEMQTWIRDFAGFGTAVLYMEEDLNRGKIDYMTIHTGQVYLEHNFWGVVDTLNRKIRRMQARQILSFFGDDTPDEVRKAVETNPFGEWEVIHSVYPREERDPSKRDNKNMPFESVWILRGQSGSSNSRSTGNSNAHAQPQIIRESGFEDFPYVVAFWEKAGNESYGRCPGMYALADVMGLNLMGKTVLELAEKTADPAYIVDVKMEGQPNFMPRGLNWVNDPSEDPRPIPMPGGYPITINEIDRKEEFINKHFDVEAFLFFASQDRDLTATEVVAREGEKVTLLGPAIGKMSQALDQIIERALKIEIEAGRIPQPPQVVFDVGESDFDIVYMGPLAQAQRALFQSSGINRGIDLIAPMLEVDPNILDIIDWDVAAREQLQAAGFPEAAIRDAQEVQARRQQRQQQIEQARQLEAAESNARATKDLAKADKDTDGGVSQAMADIEETQ